MFKESIRYEKNDTTLQDMTAINALQTDNQFKFFFSIIMSVYNVEPYIKQAVDSIITQTIGFEHIQIIFVDDGSTDQSGAICDEYRKQYEDNIIVIHKENAGLSSARMVGIQHIQGEFISFFDPDDILTPNTLEDVYNFFIQNKEEIDVVSIPLFMFGQKNGKHPLNYKYDSGSRVIDLKEEPDAILLSCASAFYTRNAVAIMDFDTEIVTAEDAKENVKVLLEKQKMGVVSTARYKYRIRVDSNVRGAQKKKGWYIDYLDRYSYWAIEYCNEKVGYIPQFIQYMIFYDLQWKYLNAEIPSGILSLEEEDIYRNKLFDIVKYIDDDVIVRQHNIYVDHKLFLLYKKHGHEPDYYVDMGNTVYYGYDNKLYGNYNATLSHMNFLKFRNNRVYIQADQITFERCKEDAPTFFFTINDKEIIATTALHYERKVKSVGVEIATVHHFEGYIPLDEIDKKIYIKIMTKYKHFNVMQRRTLYGKYFPVTDKFRNSYFYKENIVFHSVKGGISAERINDDQLCQREEKYVKSLRAENNIRARNALLSRKLFFFIKKFVPTNIWLIMDKASQAGDNGEAFFQYLVKSKNKECRPIFVVGEKTADYKKLKKIGHVVPYMSYRHKILFLFAEFVISAYSHDEVCSPYLKHNYYYTNLIQDSKIVFLQHGITKDDVSVGLNRMNKNFALFITATNKEQESIIDGNYGYEKEQVVLTGLPRYDLLYNNPKKIITIMPTWKRDLCGSYDPHTSQWSLLPGFESSQYYLFYNELINSEKLLDFAETLGYEIRFLIHPVFQPYVDKFTPDNRITILDSSMAYRDIFAESSMIVTDYSSVAFDFAYLYKPVLYTHFEGNHYQEGYFNYEQDGFGEIAHSINDTVNILIEYMKNGCKLKDVYKQRIDAFFTFHDKNNSARVYKEILALRDKTY